MVDLASMVVQHHGLIAANGAPLALRRFRVGLTGPALPPAHTKAGLDWWLGGSAGRPGYCPNAGKI